MNQLESLRLYCILEENLKSLERKVKKYEKKHYLRLSYNVRFNFLDCVYQSDKERITMLQTLLQTIRKSGGIQFDGSTIDSIESEHEEWQQEDKFEKQVLKEKNKKKKRFKLIG